MDLVDTGRMLAHRVKVAGYAGPQLFTDEAVKEIYRYARGIPRVICSVADLALVVGHSRSVRQIHDREIFMSIRDMDRSTQDGYHYYHFLRSAGAATPEEQKEIAAAEAQLDSQEAETALSRLEATEQEGTEPVASLAAAIESWSSEDLPDAAEEPVAEVVVPEGTPATEAVVPESAPVEEEAVGEVEPEAAPGTAAVESAEQLAGETVEEEVEAEEEPDEAEPEEELEEELAETDAEEEVEEKPEEPIEAEIAEESREELAEEEEGEEEAPFEEVMDEEGPDTDPDSIPLISDFQFDHYGDESDEDVAAFDRRMTEPAIRFESDLVAMEEPDGADYPPVRDLSGEEPVVGCPSCGARQPADRSSCVQCGGPLHWICPACQFKNTAHVTRCDRCGQSLSRALSEAEHLLRESVNSSVSGPLWGFISTPDFSLKLAEGERILAVVKNKPVLGKGITIRARTQAWGPREQKVDLVITNHRLHIVARELQSRVPYHELQGVRAGKGKVHLFFKDGGLRFSFPATESAIYSLTRNLIEFLDFQASRFRV
jgi:hypothetical protein